MPRDPAGDGCLSHDGDGRSGDATAIRQRVGGGCSAASRRGRHLVGGGAARLTSRRRLDRNRRKVCGGKLCSGKLDPECCPITGGDRRGGDDDRGENCGRWTCNHLVGEVRRGSGVGDGRRGDTPTVSMGDGCGIGSSDDLRIEKREEGVICRVRDGGNVDLDGLLRRELGNGLRGSSAAACSASSAASSRARSRSRNSRLVRGASGDPPTPDEAGVRGEECKTIPSAQVRNRAEQHVNGQGIPVTDW